MGKVAIKKNEFDDILLAPNIIKYNDYRIFLKDYYNYKKNLRSGFSFRQFSAKCGFNSPNYLQLIMKGERNLSVTMSHSVANAIGLKNYEQDYFVSLVHQENAKTDDELKIAKKESLVAIKKLVTKQIFQEQNEIFEKWYHLLVRECVLLNDFEASGEFVCKALNYEISLDEAQKSLELLVKLGFIEKNKNGKWMQKEPVLDSGDGVFREHLINRCHAHTLKLWAKKIESQSQFENELGLLNIPIQKSKIPELQKKLRQFQDEIIGWLQADENQDQLVQVGIYMIKV